jgi:hypothetical protein
VVAIVLSLYAFNQQGIAQDSAATAQSEAIARATQQAVAESEADMRATQQAVAESESIARATQQAIAETEAKARGVAEEQALEERDRAIEAEQDALIQASIGLGSQAFQELSGNTPERAVPLALEALEDYPYTWQAERALGQAVLTNRLRLVLNHDALVVTAEWSADGTKILTGSLDDTIRVWDASNGNELIRITGGTPTYASWSPDSKSILVFGYPLESEREFHSLGDMMAKVEGLGDQERIEKSLLLFGTPNQVAHASHWMKMKQDSL